MFAVYVRCGYFNACNFVAVLTVCFVRGVDSYVELTAAAVPGCNQVCVRRAVSVGFCEMVGRAFAYPSKGH